MINVSEYFDQFYCEPYELYRYMVPCSNIFSRCVFLLDQKHVFHIRYKKLVQLQITEKQILYFSLYISTFRLLFTIGGGAVLKFCRKWKCLWAVLWLVVLWVDYSKVIHCDSISLFLPWLVVIGVDDTKVIYHFSVSLVLLCSTVYCTPRVFYLCLIFYNLYISLLFVFHLCIILLHLRFSHTFSIAGPLFCTEFWSRILIFHKLFWMMAADNLGLFFFSPTS